MTSYRKFCAKRARASASFTCPAITTNSCAATTVPISAASRSCENTIHTGVDGRRYLVVHGDIFDLVVTQARWLALLGDKAYEFALTANRVFNAFRRVLGCAVLVAVEMGEAEGQERRQLHRRVREGAGDRSQAPSG